VKPLTWEATEKGANKDRGADPGLGARTRIEKNSEVSEGVVEKDEAARYVKVGEVLEVGGGKQRNQLI